MKEIKDYSLLPHNTFGMDVKASLFVEYESVTELQSILSDKKLMAGNWLHIGGGSNLLFKGDYAGTVLPLPLFPVRFQQPPHTPG